MYWAGTVAESWESETWAVGSASEFHKITDPGMRDAPYTMRLKSSFPPAVTAPGLSCVMSGEPNKTWKGNGFDVPPRVPPLVTVIWCWPAETRFALGMLTTT